MKGIGKGIAIAAVVFIALVLWWPSDDSDSDTSDMVVIPESQTTVQYDYSVPDDALQNPSSYSTYDTYDTYGSYDTYDTYSAPKPQLQLCGVCRGGTLCKTCGGTGIYSNYGQRIECTSCHGSGDCWKCGGTGYY